MVLYTILISSPLIYIHVNSHIIITSSVVSGYEYLILTWETQVQTPFKSRPFLLFSSFSWTQPNFHQKPKLKFEIRQLFSNEYQNFDHKGSKKVIRIEKSYVENCTAQSKVKQHFAHKSAAELSIFKSQTIFGIYGVSQIQGYLQKSCTQLSFFTILKERLVMKFL